jgi:hypothetical protein
MWGHLSKTYCAPLSRLGWDVTPISGAKWCSGPGVGVTVPADHAVGGGHDGLRRTVIPAMGREGRALTRQRLTATVGEHGVEEDIDENVEVLPVFPANRFTPTQHA